MLQITRYKHNLICLTGIVGRISPKTWAAMEVFLESLAVGEYESMASSLIDMGATSKNVDAKAFARDLETIFSSIQARVSVASSMSLRFLFYKVKV